MTEEIKQSCRDLGQEVPETPGELAAVIYKSLAKCYGDTIKEIETNTDHRYDVVHIIGGGCKNSYLNQLTANATGRTVYAGPSEATAIGNVMVQMISDGLLSDLKEARACVNDSFGIEIFAPGS